MSEPKVHSIMPYCLSTLVSEKALSGLLEATNEGTYKDAHPWLVAQELVTQAQQSDQRVVLMFAVSSEPGVQTFSHWGFISQLEVFELHRATWETRCTVTNLKAVNPIWHEIDSVFLKPSPEQIRREEIEGIHAHRYALNVSEIFPYAICETPAFIVNEGAGDD